jgi:hypothetical protein
LIDREDDSEMRDGHILAIDGVRQSSALGVRREMGDDLMTIEIEIDPVVGAPPFGAAEQLAVEAARSGKIVDGKGEVEGRKDHGPALLGHSALVEAFVGPP